MLTCPACGKAFAPRRRDQSCCSSRCSGTSRMKSWRAAHAAPKPEPDPATDPDCFCGRDGADICPTHRPGEVERRTLNDETFWAALRNGGR